MNQTAGENPLLTRRWWRSSRFTELLYRQWEGETFVFNPHTGHTHILNEISWEILLTCAQAAHSEEQLFELLTPDEATEIPDQEAADSLLAHLDQLEQLNLIQSLSSHATH